VTTPPPSPVAERVLEVLRARDGTATEVRLHDGRTCTVFNVAWGQDFEDPEYHITSNISPDIDGASMDFFFTNHVVALVDPATGTILYDRDAH